MSGAMFRTMHHTASLQPTKESVHEFRRILEDEASRNKVRKADILIHKVENENCQWYPDSGWADCLDLLPKFTNLNEVTIRFPEDVYNDQRDPWRHAWRESGSIEFRTTVLNKFFSALSKDGVAVDTLTIENLQDHTLGVYDTDAFKAVRDRLKSLHLMMAVEENPTGEDDIDLPEKHEFFNHELNKHWLKPLERQLTDLSIHCINYWGVYPAWDSRSLHFPALRSLSLGNWTLAHEWQIDWLLSHGATLEELYLGNSPIVYAMRLEEHQYAGLSVSEKQEQGPDECHPAIFPNLRWAKVFPRFTKHLTALKRFGMSCIHDFHQHEAGQLASFDRRYELPTRLDTSRYILFDTGTMPSVWIEAGYTIQHKIEPETGEEEQERAEDHSSGWAIDAEEWDYPVKDRLKWPGGREEEQAALDEFIAGSKGRPPLQVFTGEDVHADQPSIRRTSANLKSITIKPRN